jgi:Protein of unknown function (DUF2939)
MHCSNCGNKVKAAANFCNGCGSPVEAPKISPAYPYYPARPQNNAPLYFGIAFVIGILGLIASVVSPYWTAYSFVCAITKHDAPALLGMIDFETLKQNIKEHALENSSHEDGFQKLGTMIGLAILDSTFTPNNLVAMMFSQVPKNEHPDVSYSEFSTSSYQSLDSFILRRRGASSALTFHREGPFSWKLVDIADETVSSAFSQQPAAQADAPTTTTSSEQTASYAPSLPSAAPETTQPTEQPKDDPQSTSETAESAQNMPTATTPQDAIDQLIAADISSHPETVGPFLGLIRSFPRTSPGDSVKATAINKQGLAKLRASDFEEATKLFHEASLIDPSDAKLYSNLGFAEMQKGDTNQAQLDFYTSLSLDPYRSVAWDDLGEAFAKNNEQDRAVNCFLVAFKVSDGKSKEFLTWLLQDSDSKVVAADSAALDKINSSHLPF